jgi:zinc transporter ZupT
VAILLRSSFTETQTVLCNGFINLLSLIGVFIGLAVVSMSSAVKQYIMVFVAGNFIYIASDIWQHILKNKGEKAKCSNTL